MNEINWWAVAGSIAIVFVFRFVFDRLIARFGRKAGRKGKHSTPPKSYIYRYNETLYRFNSRGGTLFARRRGETIDILYTNSKGYTTNKNLIDAEIK